MFSPWTIKSVSAYTVTGTYDGDSSTTITIGFTAASANGVLAWGAHIRGDDGKCGQTPFSHGLSTEEKMGSDPISLQRHFRHGLIGIVPP